MLERLGDTLKAQLSRFAAAVVVVVVAYSRDTFNIDGCVFPRVVDTDSATRRHLSSRVYVRNETIVPQLCIEHYILLGFHSFLALSQQLCSSPSRWHERGRDVRLLLLLLLLLVLLLWLVLLLDWERRSQGVRRRRRRRRRRRIRNSHDARRIWSWIGLLIYSS